MKRTIVTISAVILFLSSAAQQTSSKQSFISENIAYAQAQTELMLNAVGEPTTKNYPRTMNDKGEIRFTGMYDWTPGFFPGSLWYLYELSGNARWKEVAEKWTTTLEPLKTFTDHHDLGFMVYCSYGNAERLAPKQEYKNIITESANSLSTRFSDKTGVIKSWNGGKSWNGEHPWHYPVIIDNMMNLEMLFYASKVAGDKKFYDLAVTHAETTLKNHFRDDFSTYHIVSYDPEKGGTTYSGTCQGYSDNSTWSRGQAWAVYGFTMTYRETKEQKFLQAAVRAADFFIKNLPEDMVPVWDFNVDQPGYNPEGSSKAVQNRGKYRDASAAAIVCSALFELGQLTNDKSYLDTAEKMLYSLASSAYRAKLGTNANFLIEHCVGSLPHGNEIDKPLVYADYYFLEALVRYKNLINCL